MIITKGNTITIIIDNEELNDYLEYYFFKHPARKKKPIERTIPPSLNQWGNMNRHAKNTLKQNWSDFAVWLIEKYNMQKLDIQKCEMTYRYFFHTKHERDLFNYSPKFLEDGFVIAGLLNDDNYNVVNPVRIEYGGYDKGNARIEIVIERLDLD